MAVHCSNAGLIFLMSNFSRLKTLLIKHEEGEEQEQEEEEE